jgi:hypothetical protein
MLTKLAIAHSALFKRMGVSTVHVYLSAATGSGAAMTGCIDSERDVASTAMVGNVTEMALELRLACPDGMEGTMSNLVTNTTLLQVFTLTRSSCSSPCRVYAPSSSTASSASRTSSGPAAR